MGAIKTGVLWLVLVCLLPFACVGCLAGLAYMGLLAGYKAFAAVVDWAQFD